MTGSITRAATTVVNPRYADDLRILENSADPRALFGSETVFIVTGCGIDAELLDRPAAMVLRDEIDRRGEGVPLRRAIVVGDSCWQRLALQHNNAVIAIGGAEANSAAMALQRRRDAGQPWRVEGDLHGMFAPGPPPGAALWGTSGGAQTLRSVERYCIRPEGLEDFLSHVWVD